MDNVVKRAEITIGRDELTEAVYRLGLNKSRQQARDLVDQVLGEIVEGLLHDRIVSLHGFGAFRVSLKQERAGRNPQTGKAYPIRARRSVSFKPSRTLRGSVADGAG